jgi:hypothetical protein
MNPTERIIAQPGASLAGRSVKCRLGFVVAFVLAGCGRQGGLGGSGAQPTGDAAAGGSGGSAVGGSADAGRPAGGGGSTASPVGGAAAGGGASGANTTTAGGASPGGNAAGGSGMGGVTASGGVTSRGGSAGAGTSGGGSAGGGGAPSGGAGAATTAVVGGSASGGVSGGGGGGAGTARGGAASSGGSPGSGGGGAGGGPDGGILASGYCTGGDAKVTYLGQTVSAPATSYQSGLALDCCMSHGVNLHSRASLGFDFAVEVIMSMGLAPGDYEVGTGFQLRAFVRTSNEPPQALTNPASGNLHISGGPPAAQAWSFGLCLEVVDASSALLGTRIYVPSVVMDTYQSYKRFQIYLLQDSSVTALNAAKLALDSLVLAAQPLLDLSRIAYVEQATTRIGFNPGQKIGDSIRSSHPYPLGLPFVVVADDVRIYLGTFTSMISSISPAGPPIMTDDITSNELVIRPPWTGTDPRNDPRILQVLTETGKLVGP